MYIICISYVYHMYIICIINRIRWLDLKRLPERYDTGEAPTVVDDLLKYDLLLAGEDVTIAHAQQIVQATEDDHLSVQ